VTDPLDGNGKALVDGNPLPQAPRSRSTSRSSTRSGGAGDIYVLNDWVYRSKVTLHLRIDRVHRQVAHRRWLRIGYTWATQVRRGAVRAQHHEPDPRRRGIDFNNLTASSTIRALGAQFKASF